MDWETFGVVRAYDWGVYHGITDFMVHSGEERGHAWFVDWAASGLFLPPLLACLPAGSLAAQPRQLLCFLYYSAAAYRRTGQMVKKHNWVIY